MSAGRNSRDDRTGSRIVRGVIGVVAIALAVLLALRPLTTLQVRAPASRGSIVTAAPNRRARRRRFLSGSETMTFAPRSAAIAVAERPTRPAPVTSTTAPGTATSRAARRSAAHAVAAPHAAGAATRAGMRSPTGTIAVPARTWTWVAKPPLSSQCAPMRS